MASEKGFGTPSEIIIDGRRMSSEEFEEHIVQSGVPQVDVKSFALTRINGVVKLYIATIRQEETQMKTISFKQIEGALFNLDSMRTKLMNERTAAGAFED